MWCVADLTGGPLEQNRLKSQEYDGGTLVSPQKRNPKKQNKPFTDVDLYMQAWKYRRKR